MFASILHGQIVISQFEYDTVHFLHSVSWYVQEKVRKLCYENQGNCKHIRPKMQICHELSGDDHLLDYEPEENNRCDYDSLK